MLTVSSLQARGMSEDEAHEESIRHGSDLLRRAITGEKEPEPIVKLPEPKRKPKSREYVPVKQRPEVTIPKRARETILKVCEAFEIPEELFMSHTRTLRPVVARAVAIQLLSERRTSLGDPLYSSTTLGRFLRRDHSSILNALHKFDGYCRVYPGVREVYEGLKE